MTFSDAAGSICDATGIRVGHFTDPRRPTGCTVILTENGAVAGVDVRGSAPGTRETDLLNPVHTVQEIHAVLLAGGSAFGLDAAAGVMKYLEEKGIGFDAGMARIPIVCAAVIFDLSLVRRLALAPPPKGMSELEQEPVWAKCSAWKRL
jgi:L-aminopeptidase/D-esterase-like protein